jgi:hypothetical protein
LKVKYFSAFLAFGYDIRNEALITSETFKSFLEEIENLEEIVSGIIEFSFLSTLVKTMNFFDPNKATLLIAG